MTDCEPACISVPGPWNWSCCLECQTVSLPTTVCKFFHFLTFLFVEPADAAAVIMRLEEQLSEELPQVDGLGGVFTHHVWPGIIISCWHRGHFRDQMSIFWLNCDFLVLVLTKNLPDFPSSGGERSFIDAAEENTKKKSNSAVYTTLNTNSHIFALGQFANITAELI